MLTLYTAVGSLQFVNVNGKPVPHVINNQKEYGMSKEELLVWSCLAFQILTYPELEHLFEKNCADSGQSISLPLSHYLNRLLLRWSSPFHRYFPYHSMIGVSCHTSQTKENQRL